MKLEHKMRELTDKLKRQNKALSKSIRQEIDKKYAKFCQSTSKAIDKEKDDLLKKQQVILKSINEKMLKQQKITEKVKHRLKKINLMHEKVNFDEFSKCIEKSKSEIEKVFKQQSGELEKIKEKQQSHYKAVLDSIQRDSNNLSDNCIKKINSMM